MLGTIGYVLMWVLIIHFLLSLSSSISDWMTSRKKK